MKPRATRVMIAQRKDKRKAQAKPDRDKALQRALKKLEREGDRPALELTMWDF